MTSWLIVFSSLCILTDSSLVLSITDRGELKSRTSNMNFSFSFQLYQFYIIYCFIQWAIFLSTYIYFNFNFKIIIESQEVAKVVQRSLMYPHPSFPNSNILYYCSIWKAGNWHCYNPQTLLKFQQVLHALMHVCVYE